MVTLQNTLSFAQVRKITYKELFNSLDLAVTLLNFLFGVYLYLLLIGLELQLILIFTCSLI